MRQVEAQAANDDPQMARLDPRASKLKYRLERLMLTPFFRFTLRVLLPFGLCFGIGAAWFAVDENREAFHLMLSEVRDTVENRPEFQVRMMAIDGAAPTRLTDDVRERMPDALVLAHLLLALFWVYDTSEGRQRTRLLLDRSLRLLSAVLPLARLPLVRGAVAEVLALVGSVRA